MSSPTIWFDYKLLKQARVDLGFSSQEAVAAAIEEHTGRRISSDHYGRFERATINDGGFRATNSKAKLVIRFATEVLGIEESELLVAVDAASDGAASGAAQLDVEAEDKGPASLSEKPDVFVAWARTFEELGVPPPEPEFQKEMEREREIDMEALRAQLRSRINFKLNEACRLARGGSRSDLDSAGAELAKVRALFEDEPGLLTPHLEERCTNIANACRRSPQPARFR